MNESFLKRCNRIYEALVEHIVNLKKKEDAETVLTWIQMVADFCWRNHTGRYADGRIENIAFEIGEDLEKTLTQTPLEFSNLKLSKPDKDNRRRILHIATTVYKIGGHTRLISAWIKNDPGTCHSLLLTNQGNGQIPEWLSHTVNKNGGELTVLPSDASLLLKARWLREFVQANVDMIILHHHPNDVLPVVAFATKQCPPIAILNHADHAFWMGSSIADTVINIRMSGKTLSEERRFTKPNLLLPIPLNPRLPDVTREEARRQLNIPDQQVVLLSIGKAYKYIPTETHNFYRAVVKVLNAYPEAHLYLVGVEWCESTDYLRETKHHRLHLLGEIEHPYLYRVAADLYLEGFPIGSLTALLEVALSGVYPVLSFAPMSSTLVSNDLALVGLTNLAMSEDEYVEGVKFLIQNQEYREKIGNQIKERVTEYHVGRKWNEYLQAVYQYLEDKSHEPSRIPNSAYSESSDDLSLSRVGMLLHSDPKRDPCLYDNPPLLGFGRQYFARARVKDLTRLFFLSLKTQDTKLCQRHIQYWVNVFSEYQDQSDADNFLNRHPQLKARLRIFVSLGWKGYKKLRALMNQN